MKKLIYLIIVLMLLMPGVVKAEYITVGAPNVYLDTTEGTISLSANTASWWSSNWWESSGQFYASAMAGATSFNFQWPNAQLCSSSQKMAVTGEIGVPYDGTAQNSLLTNASIWSNIGGVDNTCTYTYLSSDRIRFTCTGQGGTNIIIGVTPNNGLANVFYSFGINKQLEVTCDTSTGQIIDNQNANAQNIINNQNENAQEIIDNNNQNTAWEVNTANANQQQTNERLDETNSKLNDINSTLTDDTPPESDISSLGNVQGLLPAGPVDNLLNIPFYFLSIVTSSFGGVCTPLTGNFVFDTELSIPCFSELIYTDMPEGIMVFINLIPTAFLLIVYFKHLYKKVDRAVSLETTGDDEWGVL